MKITVVRNQTAKATFVNERDTGNASIIKKWTNPNGLTTAQKAKLEKNVYFTVKNADGAYLKAVSKNGKYVYNGSQTAEARFMLTNGKFELTELPTGKYTITEINNAEGYLPKTQVKTITVTKDATASAEFVNKVIVGNVTLTKVDEDYPENKLTGAVFTVYKSDKKTVVGTLKETETGVYSLEGLVYGEYYVQETKAPEYFVRDVNFYYFQIVNDGETVEVSNDELGKGTFINSPQKGEIKIVKTSYDNKVEGFSFEVTGKTFTGQTFKKTYTTDKNGIIRINDLRAGEYNIHEVNDSASAGYLLPDDKQLTIDRDGAKLVAEMHNSKLPDNPPTGASEDSFTQTAVIIISMVMMSAAVVLVFPLSKRKRKR
ncbi:MAG: SpaA isopeptide-forming pilin-related protein [[Eubacterium] siraeum]